MKQKVNQTAAKRFKLTSLGKLKRDQAGTSHLLRNKSIRRTQVSTVAKADVKRIRRMLALG